MSLRFPRGARPPREACEQGTRCLGPAEPVVDSRLGSALATLQAPQPRAEEPGPPEAQPLRGGAGDAAGGGRLSLACAPELGSGLRPWASAKAFVTLGEIIIMIIFKLSFPARPRGRGLGARLTAP